MQVAKVLFHFTSQYSSLQFFVVVSIKKEMPCVTRSLIMIKIISPGCYQLFTSNYGNIYSPNYPRSYGPNQDCVYNITLPYGYVRLYFYTFSVESCPHDYLNVYNGWSLSHQRIIGQYCGVNRPPTYIYSSGRHLILHFHSDHSVQLSGFRIYYTIVYSGKTFKQVM